MRTRCCAPQWTVCSGMVADMSENDRGKVQPEPRSRYLARVLAGSSAWQSNFKLHLEQLAQDCAHETLYTYSLVLVESNLLVLELVAGYLSASVSDSSTVPAISKQLN